MYALHFDKKPIKQEIITVTMGVYTRKHMREKKSSNKMHDFIRKITA